MRVARQFTQQAFPNFTMQQPLVRTYVFVEILRRLSAMHVVVHALEMARIVLRLVAQSLARLGLHV